MDFSLFDMINKLNPAAITIAVLGGIVLLYLPLYKTSHIIMLILALSASLAGSSVPVFDTLSTLLRWVSIALLFIWGAMRLRIKVSWGILLFWGYVFWGFIFMFYAISIEWQIQKGILLLLVSLALPLAFSQEPYDSVKLSLISVSIAGSVFSIINFVPLPGHLNEPVRFAGYCKNAGLLVEFLGAFLPFILWGLWKAEYLFVRGLCGLGFFLGVVTLIFSGQRSGMMGGLIGIVPLLFLLLKESKAKLLFLLIFFPSAVGYFLFQQSSFGKLNFLFDRYSLGHGLSGREAIWRESFAAIETNPLMGQGIGAAENILSFSFHNAYLEVWFNAGLLGLACFLGAQGYFLYRIGFLKMQSRDPEILSFLALALGYMLGFIFMSLFESIGAGASNLNIILYLFLGVLVSNNLLLEPRNLSKMNHPVLT